MSEHNPSLDEVIARAAHLAAPVFKKNKWKWAIANTNPSETAVPDEATIAVHLARMVSSIDAGSDEAQGTGTGMVRFSPASDENLARVRQLVTT